MQWFDNFSVFMFGLHTLFSVPPTVSVVYYMRPWRFSLIEGVQGPTVEETANVADVFPDHPELTLVPLVCHADVGTQGIASDERGNDVLAPILGPKAVLREVSLGQIRKHI